MIVLKRRKGRRQRLRIGANVTRTVKVTPSYVSLAIDCPKDIRIFRSEAEQKAIAPLQEATP